jgi:hypothetical protein
VVGADAGSVIVVLCGISRGQTDRGLPWLWRPTPVALRATRWWRRRPPSRARVLCRSADGLTVRLGEDASVELRLRSALLWPGRVFGARPRPCLAGSRAVLASRGAGGRAEGEASLGGVRLRLDGATAYVEKKWAPGLAGHWWWATPTPPPNGRGTWIAREGGPTSGREGPNARRPADARPRSRHSSGRRSGWR